MNIREFVNLTAALAPLSVAQMMERYHVTEECAREDLRNSWLLTLRVATTDAVLDDPLPSPEQFSQVCDFDAFVIGDVSLAKELVDWGNEFWIIGGIMQGHLLINQLDKRIYYADYDSAADYEYAKFQPCAKNFGALLAALIYYFRYVREFYTTDSDSQPLLLTTEELITNTLDASGVKDSNSIFTEIYSN